MPTKRGAIPRIPLLPGEDPNRANAYAGAAPLAPNTITYEEGGQVKRFRAPTATGPQWNVTAPGGVPVAQPHTPMQQSMIPLTPPAPAVPAVQPFNPAEKQEFLGTITQGIKSNRNVRPWIEQAVQDGRLRIEDLPYSMQVQYKTNTLPQGEFLDRVNLEKHLQTIRADADMLAANAKDARIQRRAVMSAQSYGDFSQYQLPASTMSAVRRLQSQAVAKPEIAPELNKQIVDILESNRDNMEIAGRQADTRRAMDERQNKTQDAAAEQRRFDFKVKAAEKRLAEQRRIVDKLQDKLIDADESTKKEIADQLAIEQGRLATADAAVEGLYARGQAMGREDEIMPLGGQPGAAQPVAPDADIAGEMQAGQGQAPPAAGEQPQAAPQEGATAQPPATATPQDYTARRAATKDPQALAQIDNEQVADIGQRVKNGTALGDPQLIAEVQAMPPAAIWRLKQHLFELGILVERPAK